jgi:hypothetical protein
MKKHLPCLLLLCVAGLFIHPVKAQQKIVPADVKKIILDCGNDYIPRGGDNYEFEVLNEQGKWNSYQTGENVTDSNQPESNIHSVERTQIGTLSAQQIANFLSCLTVIKPQFDAKALNITPAVLIAEIKQKAKDTADNTIQLSDFITETNVQHAITNAMQDVSVDTYDYCRIRVIKNNNDTLKIETGHSYATMLPWAINKVDTYDMGINDFFIAAMCNRDYPNKEMLSLRHLKENICQFIDADYPAHPISTYRRKYCITDNIKLLKANFKPDFAIGEGPGFSNRYDLKLKTNMMPDNMFIFVYINLEEQAGILALINYGKQIDQYLKQNNFALQYYSTRPQYHVEFSYSNSGTNSYITEAKQNIPALKNIDASQTVPFFVSEIGKVLIQSSDWFLLLPDNRFVMAHRYLNKPVNTFTPIFPPDHPKANASNTTLKYALFNADGTVVK